MVIILKFGQIFRKEKAEIYIDNGIKIFYTIFLQISIRKFLSRDYFLSNRGGMAHLTCKSFGFNVLYRG